MRANPSLTTTGNWQVSSVANITITSFSLVDNVIKNINTIQIRGTVASGGVAGDGGMIRNTDATATFILSSEL
jgi:glutamate synthase domain-containing protein 1